MEKSNQHLYAEHGGEVGMTAMSRQEEILQRHREGEGIKRIAREMALSRNTVREVVREGKPRKYQRRVEKERKIGPYEEWMRIRFYEVEGNASMLYQEARERGYSGG